MEQIDSRLKPSLTLLEEVDNQPEERGGGGAEPNPDRLKSFSLTGGNDICKSVQENQT